MSKGLTSDNPRKPFVSYHASNYSTILLLNPCLVIFMICPGPSELNMMLLAEFQQGIIYKRTIIIRINPQYRKWNLLKNRIKSFDNKGLLSNEKWYEFRPAGANISRNKSVNKRTSHITAMN